MVTNEGDQIVEIFDEEEWCAGFAGLKGVPRYAGCVLVYPSHL